MVATVVLLASHILFKVFLGLSQAPGFGSSQGVNCFSEKRMWFTCSCTWGLCWCPRVWVLLSSFQGKGWVHLSKNNLCIILGEFSSVSRCISLGATVKKLFIKILFLFSCYWMLGFNWHCFLNYIHLIQSLDSWILSINSDLLCWTLKGSKLCGGVGECDMTRGGPVQVMGLQNSWLRKWCLVYPVMEMLMKSPSMCGRNKSWILRG